MVLWVVRYHIGFLACFATRTKSLDVGVHVWPIVAVFQQGIDFICSEMCNIMIFVDDGGP